MRKDSTLGNRVSDSVASFGGSWRFIFIFGIFLLVWVVMNVLCVTKAAHWDEYPFILLNLCLSFVAAFQAPFIMMSQNRHAKKQDESNTRVLEEIRSSVQKDLEVDYEDSVKVSELVVKVDELNRKISLVLSKSK